MWNCVGSQYTKGVQVGDRWWEPNWEADSDPDSGWEFTTSVDSAQSDADEVQPEEVLVRALGVDGQVRSRDRVRDLAEVFTHQREVDAILDMMPDAFKALDVKFLEPTCGSGNFLVEVLRRKLRLVACTDCMCQEHYEHRLLRVIASIYGVDISHENVTEARGRMAHLLLDHYETDGNTLRPTQGFLVAASLILSANIIQGDTLNAADEIEMCDWQPQPGGCFVRVWSCALVPVGERDLFWEERIQDGQPVHYSELATADVRANETGAKR